MMALVKKGVNRQEAHELLRQLTIKSAAEKKPFKQVLDRRQIRSSNFSEKEIDAALNPKTTWAQPLSKQNGSRRAIRSQIALFVGFPQALLLQ